MVFQLLIKCTSNQMDFDFDLKGTECFSIFVDFWNFTKFTGA